MKEKIFMVFVMLFLVSCGEMPNNSDNSSNNNNNFGSGLYNSPILVGDIVEKPASGIYVTGNDITNPSFPTVELTSNKTTTLVNGALSPVSV